MIGTDIHKFAQKLWPINRSLTGSGVRETLEHIKSHLPNLSIESVPSGTKAFDWYVPREWHVSEAFIITPSGEKICDFSVNNLHLMGYSTPFIGQLDLETLKKHLYTLPNQRNAIPYVTSYYTERWGFALTQEQFDALEEGIYTVNVKTELFDGFLNYGELKIKGKSDKEIFLSTYICHPSMANNELSGVAVQTFLAKWLESLKETEHSFRIIFIPETIGAIVYLSKNYLEMKSKILSGFNVSCIGDERSYSYLPSRNGNTLSDRAAKHILHNIDKNYKKYTWLDRGSDERQYCAPGIDLPVSSIMRSMYGEYPEYHTSLDDLETVVTAKGLDGGYWALRRTIELLERNNFYGATMLGEPQLGRRGLYPTLLTNKYGGSLKMMMDLISLCDGENDVIMIAETLKVPAWTLYPVIDLLVENELISVTPAAV